MFVSLATDQGQSVDEEAATIAVVRTIEAFDALERDWAELCAGAHENPFLSFAWTRACFEAQRPIATPFIVTARRRGKLIGIAPLCLERRLGLRVLRFIAEDRSDYLGFISDPNAETDRLLLNRLVREGGWDLLLLKKLAYPRDQFLESTLPSQCAWRIKRWTRAPYHRWKGKWDCLHESGPAWFGEMRRRLRRFHQRGGSAERYIGVEAVQMLEVATSIEAKSWKQNEGAMRLQDHYGQTLLRNAFITMPNNLEMWIAFVSGEPAAFAINLLTRDRLLLYQGSYDERFRRSGAGSVLDYLAIEHSARRGIREYDYLTGEEPYKFERTSGSRTIRHVAGYPRTVRGLIAFAMLVAPRWALRDNEPVRAVYHRTKRLGRSFSLWRSRGEILSRPLAVGPRSPVRYSHASSK